MTPARVSFIDIFFSFNLLCNTFILNDNKKAKKDVSKRSAKCWKPDTQHNKKDIFDNENG